MTLRRVLHVIPSVGPLRGGPSAVVRQLASGLSGVGIDTHVACTNDNGHGTLPIECGVPLVSDGATYWHFPRQSRFYTYSAPLGRWLSENIRTFDVVHIHALFSYASLPASYWSDKHSVPYVVRPLGTLNAWGMRERRPWLKAASFRMIESRIVQRASLMHYTSEQERAEAEALGICTPAAVIPNPLAIQSNAARGRFRRQHQAVGNRPLILFLSRIDPKKGIDLLLRALADVRVRVPGAVLVIAGDAFSSHAVEMMNLARSLGIESDVVWPGFLSGEEKQSALADADLFVLPSHSENFGVAVAEAMAAALPVVVSDQVGIHRDITSAQAGLVTGCNPFELADAIASLLNDSRRRAAMGVNGQRFAAAHYSADAVVRQLVHAYSRLVH